MYSAIRFDHHMACFGALNFAVNEKYFCAKGMWRLGCEGFRYVGLTQHDVLGVRGGGEGEKWGKWRWGRWRRGRLMSDSPHDMFCTVILKRLP